MSRSSFSYKKLFNGRNVSVAPVPVEWKKSQKPFDCNLHQLSPYIGKLKNSLACELIKNFSKSGDLIVDPFSGSGTIPLEAILQNRSVFASDISPYAKVLSKGKLFPPSSEKDALELADNLLSKAELLRPPDLRKVPLWVRMFFHPHTLKEIISFSEVCKKSGNYFLFACLLGILHHQRPGFLSYPSSHLVPYLRDKKFPYEDFPELYEYRPLRPRLLSKIKRAYRRFDDTVLSNKRIFRQSSLENVTFPEKVDCLITSPPYMNALAYGRDNRIRLWFIKPNAPQRVDSNMSQNRKGFELIITMLAKKTETSIKSKGYVVIVVGEKLKNGLKKYLSEIVFNSFSIYAPSLKLKQVLYDEIPDVRRSRKNCKGVKTEHFLIFRKN